MSKKLSFELVAVRAKNDKINTIRNINLWGCELDDVSIFRKMPNLEVISLSINNLKTLKDFKDLKNLKELYLRKNQISDIKELKYLSNCTKLSILWLNENPICQDPNYRMYVLKYLPFLDKLDDIVISESEREMASQMNNDLLNSNTFQNNINNMMNSNAFSYKNNIGYQGSDKGNYNNDLNYNNPLINSYNDYSSNFNQQKMNNTFSNEFRYSNRNFNNIENNNNKNLNYYKNDFNNSNNNFNSSNSNINNNYNNNNYNYNNTSNNFNYDNNYNLSNNLQSSMNKESNKVSDFYNNMDIRSNDNKGIMDCVLILLNKLSNDELGYVRSIIDQKIQK